ncbi:MAG: molybdopterin-synthase adenylyltransferase MoeB, partial [Deltaproteobacteria bacterium]|nr:molybdopterin-synthase adenylyltransferase MoeB [Deltaproteobacteria bacterium]
MSSPTASDLLARARAAVREVSPEALRDELASPAPPRLVDVREGEEFAAGCIPGAHSLPRGYLELRAEGELRRDERLVLYCAGGVRSALAAATLQQLGFEDVRSLAGGFNRWTDGGGAVARPRALSAAQRERYRRHLALPEVGEAGQARLAQGSALLLGAGGLGSPAALYLAAAGVGRLGVVDSDVVELSNLQRQVLHTEARAGMPKAQSARLALEALNPHVAVEPHVLRLDASNVDGLVARYDVVLDGGDNFATRYLLSDACVRARKPLVHGSVYRFEGQVTTFLPDTGPCYRCLFPAPPPPELAPSCAEAGVLGVLPGVMGLLQATEALKLLLGAGEPLAGRLLTWDALSATFRTLKVARAAG